MVVTWIMTVMYLIAIDLLRFAFFFPLTFLFFFFIFVDFPGSRLAFVIIFSPSFLILMIA